MKALILAVTILLLLLGSSGYADEAINETFENLSIGLIDGQGNWTSPPISGWPDSIADVVSSPTHSGSRALHLSRFISTATYTISSPSAANTIISFWYREQYGFGTNDTGNNMSLRNAITLSDGYNQHTTYVNICHAGTGHRSVLMTDNAIGNGGCVNGVGDMTEGNWYFIEVEYDFVNRTAHARVDGGDWGSNINLRVYGGVNGSYITSFSPMSVWDNPPQFWFDDFGQTSIEPEPSITAPLHDEEGLIMTTSGYSNFATREYFNYLRINHSGVDLALSPNGTRTASQITAGKTVYAICDGDVEFIHNGGGLYSFVKIRHPNCNGQEVIAYYGHIAVIDGLTAVKADEPIGTVKDWKGNSHLHLTIDTEPERNLSRINQLVCDYTLDANQTVTSLSNCSNTGKLTKNKMLLRVGWGQVRTQSYKDSSGHTYRKNLFISEDAMRQLGFISFFDLYQ